MLIRWKIFNSRLKILIKLNKLLTIIILRLPFPLAPSLILLPMRGNGGLFTSRWGVASSGEHFMKRKFFWGFLGKGRRNFVFLFSLPKSNFLCTNRTGGGVHFPSKRRGKGQRMKDHKWERPFCMRKPWNSPGSSSLSWIRSSVRAHHQRGFSN